MRADLHTGGLRGRGSTALVALLLVDCGPSAYRQPEGPVADFAFVSVDSRAHVDDVDGHHVGGIGYRGLSDRFFMTPGCHDLTAKYQESFVRTNGGHYVVGYNPAVGVTVALRSFFLGNEVIVSEYETNMPIRFHVPAKAGMAYWVTATFNGDRFMPRVSVLDASGERVGVILPNRPCSVAPPPASTPAP